MFKKIRFFVVLICMVGFVSGCKMTATAAGDSHFEKIAEAISAYRKSIDTFAQNKAVEGYYLDNLSAEFLKSKYQSESLFLSQLSELEPQLLSMQNKINLSILIEQLKNSTDQYHYKAHYMPLTSEFGFHSSMSFVAKRSRFKSVEDYQLYLNRLKAVPRFFEQNIMWMRKGIKVGLTQPKTVLTGYEDSIAAFIVTDAVNSEFYSPFKANNANLDEKAFLQLQKDAKKIISQFVIPSYQHYYDFFVEEYLPQARSQIAIASTVNGAAYYENRVKHYTTTTMSAEEVHNLGQAEVKRIRAEMKEVIQQVGFKGSFSEFIHFLRSDQQFYAKSKQQLLKEASFIAKKMDAQLPKLFKVLPRTPYGVAPVPDAIAPKYTTGRYVGSNRDDQAGFYWVNTYGLDKRPLYVLEALTLHEAVPGHHLQISLNKELSNLPDYRRNHYISAFGEGWGLYAEWLGLEAGFYQDPYSNFGRLTYEMWRAARLVVDTGMHMFGWSKEQAMQFMQENTALSLHNIKTETDRYISWPGQALSYKIGELTIKRLRQKAENELGNLFDVREFHHQVLKNGSVPLHLLEQQINDYIESTKKL